MGELGKVSRYKSRGAGDIKRRSQNFIGHREAQHVDEGQLDHRMLSYGEDKFFSTQHWGRQTGSKSGSSLDLAWSHVVFCALTMRVPCECNKNAALAGVAQWIEHQSANQRITGSIPSQRTCLGCSPSPQEGALERQPHIDVSSLLSLSLPLSLKINK